MYLAVAATMTCLWWSADTVAHKLDCSFILSFTQHTDAPGLFAHVLLAAAAAAIYQSLHQSSSESANRTACLSCGLIWHGVQVNELLQEKAALEGHSKQYLREKDTLHTRVTGLQADNEALADQLSASNAERNWLSERLGINAAKSRSLSEENDVLKKQLKAFQGSSSGPQGQWCFMGRLSYGQCDASCTHRHMGNDAAWTNCQMGRDYHSMTTMQ